jgi:ABC-type phosphate/phosphonate transport system substrate-binding protein
LTSPPRETREDGERIYGPIAQLLSKELGEKVIYVRAVNWIDYSNDMKKGAYDIIFDGPHFAAWRVKHLDNAPLVKLPGALTFVVIAHANDPGTNSLRDLRTGAICSLAAPNLGAMAILAQFDNPIYQPSTVEALEPMGVMKAFKANKCRAAIMMDKLLKKLSDDDKKLIKVIYTSRSYPDQTITVSKRVKEEQRKALVTALTANGGVPAAKALLGLYTKQATHFEVAQLDEYAGLEDLLEGVIWGW